MWSTSLKVLLFYLTFQSCIASPLALSLSFFLEPVSPSYCSSVGCEDANDSGLTFTLYSLFLVYSLGCCFVKTMQRPFLFGSKIFRDNLLTKPVRSIKKFWQQVTFYVNRLLRFFRFMSGRSPLLECRVDETLEVTRLYCVNHTPEELPIRNLPLWQFVWEVIFENRILHYSWP